MVHKKCTEPEKNYLIKKKKKNWEILTAKFDMNQEMIGKPIKPYKLS